MTGADRPRPSAGEAGEAIIHCARRLWQAALIAGAEGNLSVRLPGGLVLVSLSGEVRGGFRPPSSELDLHLQIYRGRDDVGAVVHAHPPTATGFAVAGQAIPDDVLPEVACLLANHGAVTWGADLPLARMRMETMEHAAKILLAARSLGQVTPLTAAQLADLTRPGGRPGDDQVDHRG